MCGRAYNPRFLFAWPNAKVSVMGAEQAASVLAQVKEDQLRRQGLSLSAEEKQALMAPVLSAYEQEGDVYFGSARMWDDGIIDPVDTRKVLALSLSACLNAPIERGPQPVYRI
jgi:3-methylcrotonyl-CoA carboxylase beta subunit